CEIAHVCSRPFQRRYALAVRLYSEAFAAAPGLANPGLSGIPEDPHRYNSACSAILAGAGQAVDLTTLGIDEWGYLTDLAHRWLRAELAARATQANDPKNRAVVHDHLWWWKQDPGLATVRDPRWLAQMTPSDRKAWESFWADVDTALAPLRE